MTLTHWFLLFGGLTILAIAIDGVRRMVSKPKTLAIDLDETLQNLVQEDYGAELPNGGARVAGAAGAVATAAEMRPVVAATMVVEAPVMETVHVETQVAPAQVRVDEIAEQQEDIESIDVTTEAVETFATDDPLIVEADLEVESLSVDEELAIEPELGMDEELVQAICQAEEVAAEEVAAEEVVAEDEEIVAQAPEFDLAAPNEQLEAKQTELVVEENPLVAAFDPTRPVHEVVESHKMVQSDMFADMEAPVENAACHSDESQNLSQNEEILNQVQDDVVAAQDDSVAVQDEEIICHSDESQNLSQNEEILNQVQDDTTAVQDDTTAAQDDTTAARDNTDFEAEWQVASAKADDILLTDTGLEDDEPQTQSLIAKVTSFAMGRKMLETRRKQAEEAQALEDLTQGEDSVVANIEQVLSIIVAAKDTQGFYGHNLKTLAQACGMVHGSMGLFHRYEDGLTEGSTQFSMANMTESGAFDMDTVDHVHTAGVVFFMTLPSANDSMRAFDYMVETAQCLANNLAGELYDDSRSVLRTQTVEHYRQRIREFERQRLARRALGGV